ncbi:MAG: phospho-sugar mutase [Clostridiales bacterium]|nr:phospho-sugar mutase [Candidatus Crickella equi]
MRTYREEYEYWMNSPVVDEASKKELAAIANDEKEIEGRFSQMLTFGTAGLRGIMAAGLNNMNVYVIRYATQALANVIIQNGGQEGGNSKEGHGVAIAYDSRNNSPLFAQEAACVLAANNIKVHLFDALRPTPELSFAVRETGSIAGINVTASHNAKEYNGYKVYWADGAQTAPDKADGISSEIDRIDIFKDVKTISFEDAKAKGLVEMLGAEMDEKYLAKVIEQSVGKKYIDAAAKDMSIVYSPFHGAGYKLVPEVLKRIGISEIIPVDEQMIPDGNFPTVKSPNPENTEGFALSIEYAKKHNAELVIGTDPDSDRCGTVVKNGDDYIVLSGNQEACLMLDYLINVKKEQGTLPADAAVCKSIVSTTMADAICEANGIKCFHVLTGFKFIGEKIKEFEESGDYSFLFGFEEAIGFLAGTYARDKDAVVAAMLMAEVGCYYKSKGMTVYEGLQELYKKYGYFVEKTESFWFEGFDAQEKMANVMVKLRENPLKKISSDVVNTIDYMDDIPGFTKSNVLSYDLADGCTVIVRPSGTEPRVKCYVMAKGDTADQAQERCQAMLAEMKEILK